jgi:hypothetical protein
MTPTAMQWVIGNMVGRFRLETAYISNGPGTCHFEIGKKNAQENSP